MMSKTKVVLFKYFDRYAITNETNYNCKIMNGSEITKFPMDSTKEDCINFILKCGYTNTDIIDKTGE